VIDCIKTLEAAARAAEAETLRLERWAQDTPPVAAEIRARGDVAGAAEMQACADEFEAAAAAARATLEQLGAAIEHARGGHERWRAYLRGAAQAAIAQRRARAATEEANPAPRLAAGGAR
jgi:hypothetical protein